jgi:hypothetical protein
MNALARNFAQNMAMEAPAIEFGQTFSYSKVFFTSLHDEFVTLEHYLEGTFAKYINNTGDICTDDIDDISLKAESFVHYTYARSDKQLMVLDIQGVNYNLCDPEIASSQLRADQADDSPILFCCGNLSQYAISQFINGHNCNKFCRLLNLPEL